MTLWQEFENDFLLEWLVAGFSSFTNKDVAKWFDVTPTDATAKIQAYQEAMLNPNVTTAFVMARQGRTSTAIWFVGEDVKALRRATFQFSNDVHNRVHTYLQPFIEMLSGKNPKTLKRAMRISGEIGRMVQQLEDLAKA